MNVPVVGESEHRGPSTASDHLTCPSCEHPTLLLHVPFDILEHCLSFLAWSDLLEVAGVSSTLRMLSSQPKLWQCLLRARHATLLDVFFDGECPESPCGLTWREHFLQFDRAWLPLAVAATGRRLILVDGRVLDVTGFENQHPGSAQILIDAVGTEASEAFHAARHSASAMRLLAEFDVGLECSRRIAWIAPQPTGLRRLLSPLVRAREVLEEIRRRVVQNTTGLDADDGYLGGDW